LSHASEPSAVAAAPRYDGALTTAAASAPARPVIAGTGVLLATALAVWLEATPLPHDATFRSVAWLMWSGNAAQATLVALLGVALHLIALGSAFVLLVWGIVRPRAPLASAPPLVQRTYATAPLWPLFLMTSQLLGRTVANLVYALAPYAAADRTPLLARLEGPLLAAIQRGMEHPFLSELFAAGYSWIWMGALLLFGPWLVLLGRTRAASRVVLGLVLTAVLAVPFFLLFPVFDPWATNSAYGFGGPGQTAVRYLYPGADPALLTWIATEDRWAAGSCLPSLHVAIPLLCALVAFRERLRASGWILAALTALTALGIVYLGRHWIVDVILAVPFVLAVHRLVERIDPDFGLGRGDEVEGSAA
jgi:membrane-associated phospholipid phosphatase